MPPINAEKEKEKEEPSTDISKYLFKTIKDCNSMSKCYFYKNGQVILFCGEKKISLCIFKTSFNDTPKIYNKSIEKNLITDICLSLDKKTIYCSNKNSKVILFYTLEKVDGKIKLVKLDKNIICNRPYEIRSIVCDKLGTLIFSIGTNDDTEIQIFDAINSELKFKESTSAIQNLQMEMGPNDSDLLISTFMNDISVLNLEKNDKFNNETKEETKKIQTEDKKKDTIESVIETNQKKKMKLMITKRKNYHRKKKDVKLMIIKKRN